MSFVALINLSEYVLSMTCENETGSLLIPNQSLNTTNKPHIHPE